jgi:integrase
MQLTAQKIRQLLKAGVEAKIADGNGLYFRITKAKSGFWVFKYSLNSKRHDMAIGKYHDISLTDARERTLLLRKQLAIGLDPRLEQARTQQNPFKTIDDLASDWLEACSRRLNNPQIPTRIYKKDIKPAIGNMRVDDVSPIDVRDILEKINASNRPTIANDALGYLKQLFRHGMKLGVVKSNPADAFRPADAGGIEKSRDHILSKGELKELFMLINKNISSFGYENMLCVKLLLRLGVRKSELIEAPWSEFNVAKRIWQLPAARSKTNTDFKIYLSDSVVKILHELKVFARGSDYLFPSRRTSIRSPCISPDTLNRAISSLLNKTDNDIEHFTVHDLRRTFRSLLSELKVQPHIAERCLNHKLKGIEQVYDRYDYFEECVEALDKVAYHFDALESAAP